MTTEGAGRTEEGAALATAGAALAKEGAALAKEGAALSNALGDLIRVVHFRDRDRACCYDVSVTQCHALKGVVDAGSLTVNDLSAHLFLDKSTTSRVAAGLVDKGLVERRRDPSDGRVIRLVPTSSGRETYARIEHDLAIEYAELLEDFDPAVREGSIRLVRRLARAFAARVDASGGTCCVVR